jgi:rubrerythrin
MNKKFTWQCVACGYCNPKLNQGKTCPNCKANTKNGKGCFRVPAYNAE